ncbi:hypothetical protein I4U23_016638 [Adineta vaga]|nr:hypothetical protein I4U23_016638 [Adineta vaga]
MYRASCFILIAFAVLFGDLFTITRASKTRKNFTEVMDHIQNDNQALFEMLHDYKENQLPRIDDLAKQEVVRRCNDKLQSNLLQRIKEYSGSFSIATKQFEMYLQESKILFPLILKSVRNAEWSEALAFFRTLDEMYANVEAMINSCYTQFKMILDVNNAFYEKNQAWVTRIVSTVALNMNDEQCQEKRSIPLTAAITFGVIYIIANIMESLQRRARNHYLDVQRRQMQREQSSNANSQIHAETIPSPIEHTPVAFDILHGRFNVVCPLLCFFSLVVYFACLLPHPEAVSCTVQLSETVERHHINYIDKIRPTHKRLKSNTDLVISDISYLALLNRTNTASQLRDSIWRSLAFNVENITKAFQESATLETKMRKNQIELEQINSAKGSVLETVKLTSATLVSKAAYMYTTMNLHLRGHLDILPELDKLADALVESVLVGRDERNYDLLNRQYKQIIERALDDVNKITNFVEPLLQQTDTALSSISNALNDAKKQEKSGQKQKLAGGVTATAGAGFFVVGAGAGVKLVLTGAAIIANPALTLGIMAAGALIGGGGAAIYHNGEQIEINAIDLTKTLKAMQASFHQIRTLTYDQREYLLGMQSHWEAQQRQLNTFQNIAVSNLHTTLNPFSEEEIEAIRQIHLRITANNRHIDQLIKNVLAITPSIKKQEQVYLDD